MVRVTTASGRSVVATLEHQFFTSIGWRPLRAAIEKRLFVAMEGTTRAATSRWETPIDFVGETWLPVQGWPYEVSDQGRVRRHDCAPKKATVGAHGYDVVSLNQSGAQRTFTVHGLVLEAWRGSRPDGMEARHLNSNRADNRLANLQWGTPAENSNDRVEADRQQRLVATFEEIVSVEDAGQHPTYDLTVDGPWHNFVADGFVVHNSYNELSARYTPLPDVNYVPTVERLMINAGGSNRQAGTVSGAESLTVAGAASFRSELQHQYATRERLYQDALNIGVPKEVARLIVPVGRYSRMRASANLRNWLQFLTLRMAPAAQYEIRQYANAVGDLIAQTFPRTWELFAEGLAA